MRELLKLVFICAGLLSTNAHACSLLDQEFSEYFERAEHVFSGQLAPGKADVIEVEKVWKGTPFTQATIALPPFPTSCDIQLAEGETYLFFENGSPPFELMMGTGTAGFDYLPAKWLSALEELSTK